MVDGAVEFSEGWWGFFFAMMDLRYSSVDAFPGTKSNLLRYARWARIDRRLHFAQRCCTCLRSADPSAP